jgi:hypothetical protein
MRDHGLYEGAGRDRIGWFEGALLRNDAMFALQATKQARPPTGAVTELEEVGVAPFKLLLPYLDWSRDKTEGWDPDDRRPGCSHRPSVSMLCHQLLCLLVLTSCSVRE